MDIMGFQEKPESNQRCDNCGVVVGKESDQKVGYRVVDGPCTGFFHSSWCYDDARKKMEDGEDEEDL